MKHSKVVHFVSLVAMIATTAFGEYRKLPSGSGVINVREAPYNAKGDGVTDDTEAIRSAVRYALEQSRYAAPPFVYLPKGTYKVSGPIEGKVAEFGWSGGWRAGMIVRGDGPENTIVKLADHLPDYSQADAPRYVFACGSESDHHTKPGDKPLDGGGNRAFRHGFYHLTVDVGAGNPGAIGIDYVTNNRGAIEDVVIRSSDPEFAGHTGLRLMRNWPGPCLYKNVKIVGFDVGIDVQHYEYGNTFEHIELEDQRIAGLRNKQNSLAIRDFKSRNKVPAIVSKDQNGLVVVDGGAFLGGSKDYPAVDGGADFYLRDLVIEGYGMAVSKGSHKKASSLTMDASGKMTIDLYTTERFSLGQEEGKAMRLPVKETPSVWPEADSQWVSPLEFVKEGEEVNDWSDAVEAALHSGRAAIYLPVGHYTVSRTMVVPPHVRLITGFQSSIGLSKEMKSDIPLFRFTGKGGASTTLEHLRIGGMVEHDADRAIVFRHVDLEAKYENTASGTGDTFFEDTIGPKPLRISHPQKVFARQLNIEFGDKPLVENHGGDLWILGYKTEGEMVCIHQTKGRTELLGALLYPLRAVQGNTPAFLIEDGEAALTYAMSGPKYPCTIRSTIKGGSQTLAGGTVGWRAVALVCVKAGANVEASGSNVEKDATEDGGIPFWSDRAANSAGIYKDPEGNRWSAVIVGNNKKTLDSAATWSPLKWNGTKRRWEGSSLSDQAPSYSSERILRGRSSSGHLAGIVFEPAASGTYRLTGEAKVETWGPPGSIDVIVCHREASGQSNILWEKRCSNHSVLDWSSIQELRHLKLEKGDALLITMASEKGGTANLRLFPEAKPTAIELEK